MSHLIDRVNFTLMKYIEDNIITQYKSFESSHDNKHILNIINNSFDIVEELEVDVDIDKVFTVAAFHDIGIPLGRDNHHITSAKIMMNDKFINEFFSKEDIYIMKEAIEDHRASSNNPPRSIYGMIIAEADRDINPDRILERCIQYALENNDDSSKEEIIDTIRKHIIDKYGDNGYLKTWLNYRKNIEGLNTIRNWIRNKELNNLIVKGIKREIDL